MKNAMVGGFPACALASFGATPTATSELVAASEVFRKVLRSMCFLL
jgi:hypothetical protein